MMTVRELVEEWPRGRSSTEEGKRMGRYRIVVGICLGGELGDTKPGQVVELPERDARQYVMQGRMAPITEEEVAAGDPEFPTGAPETAGVMNQDPKVTQRGGRRKKAESPAAAQGQ